MLPQRLCTLFGHVGFSLDHDIHGLLVFDWAFASGGIPVRHFTFVCEFGDEAFYEAWFFWWHFGWFHFHWTNFDDLRLFIREVALHGLFGFKDGLSGLRFIFGDGGAGQVDGLMTTNTIRSRYALARHFEQPTNVILDSVSVLELWVLRMLFLDVYHYAVEVSVNVKYLRFINSSIIVIKNALLRILSPRSSL